MFRFRADRHQVKGEFTSSRVDQGEGSCALLTKELKAKFLITDDLRALPELQTVADSKVAILPIVLKALVQRDVLAQEEALEKQAQLTEKGKQYLQQSEKEDLDEYENLSHKELVEEVHQLETQIEELEAKFETFREQSQRKLRQL